MAVTLAMVACYAVAGWGTYTAAPQRHAATQAEETGQHTTFHAQNLRNTLARYESLSGLATLECVLHVALQENPHAGDAVIRHTANAYLKGVQAATNLATVHLINTIGFTIATSSWDLSASFVGQNHASRLCFVEATREGLGRFYGAGNTTGETGYFVIVSVREDNRPIGMAVAEVNLDAFEATLSRSGDMMLPVDRHGVIFLSSVSKWKYRAFGTLNMDQRVTPDATHQYILYILTPFGMNDGRAASALFSADHPPQTVCVVLPGKSVSTLRMQYRPVGLFGWQAVVLIDLRNEWRTALVAGTSAVFAMAFTFVVLVVSCLHQRRREEQHRMCTALCKVQRDLEVHTAQCTVELTSANTTPVDKVEALDTAQRILRETRDIAVQAGKLAAPGQMVAGITYEPNQPLTTLTTLSDNANRLTERGRIDEVRGNLTHISQPAERMGRIVSHVKAFSCKDDVAHVAVSADEAICQMSMLVETHRRQAGATTIAGPVPVDLAVWASAVRLEQVLINLIHNAIDATAEAPVAKSSTMCVSAKPIEKWVRITVRDFGPGVPADVLPRLLEPFFTIKDDGQGLGLGLAVSLAIIEDFGGRFGGCSTGDDAGGTGFIIELERVVRPT